MAALLFKVGALALKTLAKPLGSRFEKWAMTHPVARRSVINASQVLHKWEVYITRGAEGKTGKAFVGAMTEEKSLELASKLASEGFVFTVSLQMLGSFHRPSGCMAGILESCMKHYKPSFADNWHAMPNAHGVYMHVTAYTYACRSV